MPIHMRTYPENLVNVGPVHFEIIDLQEVLDDNRAL